MNLLMFYVQIQAPRGIMLRVLSCASTSIANRVTNINMDTLLLFYLFLYVIYSEFGPSENFCFVVSYISGVIKSENGDFS